LYREDKGQFLNLPLINTLRVGGKEYFGGTARDGANSARNTKGGAGDEESNKGEGN
jgi:hypothetical protein